LLGRSVDHLDPAAHLHDTLGEAVDALGEALDLAAAVGARSGRIRREGAAFRALAGDLSEPLYIYLCQALEP